HDFSVVPSPGRVSAGEQARDAYLPSMALGRWKARTAARRRTGFAIAASLLVATLLTLAAWRPWNSLGSKLFEARVGENRQVVLADGSGLSLGGDTGVRVSFSKRSRQLTLVRGEAFFDVAKDRVRPFSVRAGEATLVAIGTQFNVRCNDDRVVVSV